MRGRNYWKLATTTKIHYWVIFKAHTTVYVQKLWSIVHLPQNQNQSWHCNFLVFVMVHFKIDILSGLDTGQVALPCSLISFWLFRVICTSDYSHDLTILSCRLAPPPPCLGLIMQQQQCSMQPLLTSIN